jgi:PAS domain S-box-containing protein
MAKKSTYQELEQRVKELEKEAAEHKRAEEALWESEAKYREVVERANDGIAIIQDGLLKYVNPRLAEMTGYGVEEGMGSPFTNYIDPAELPEAVEYYERRMAGEEVATRYERRLRHENGSMIDTEISGGLITFQHKPADLVVIRDITQRKRAEEEILRSTALLQSVFDGIAEPLIMLDKQLTVKMLNKPAIQYYQVEPQGVTGKPCHEAFKKKPEPCEGCNIPAAVLSGRAVTFERRGLMDPHREKLLNLLDSILNSVERSRTITRRLLGFAKHKDVKIEMIRLNQVLKEVLGFLEREAFHRSINISLDFSPDLPGLESDKGELQQVFLNIIKNAFEAVENRGNVTIATRLKDPDTLQATITDDGPGIAPKQLEHIFEPFHASNKEWGTGLGLYITHDIVTKNLSGQIMVKSEVGKGTTFTVELPRARKEHPNPSPKN